MCGSCAMTVNGVPRWTCRTHVDKVAFHDRLKIEPLKNLPVIRDLVTDMSVFFDKWARARGQFSGTRTKNEDFHAVKPDSASRVQADAAIECIGCGVCYSACDVVAWNPGYLGPAALNRAWTLVNDERDAAKLERLRAGSADAAIECIGCGVCYSACDVVAWNPGYLGPAALNRAWTLVNDERDAAKLE